MRNVLTIPLGLVLLVSTAFFAESGTKHAEEERLGREFQQVVTRPADSGQAPKGTWTGTSKG